ncbi:sucrose synthase [bacterium]|nr:sucrose synthase [candidate division CSSED10-310 bacterium]
MISEINNILKRYAPEFESLLRSFYSTNQSFLLQSQIKELLRKFLETDQRAHLADNLLLSLLNKAQEVAMADPWIYFAIRPEIARWVYLKFRTDSSGSIDCFQADNREFLIFKEWLISKEPVENEWILELDLGPFNREFPRMRESRSIGRGVEFLNRVLSNRLFKSEDDGHSKLFEFLKVHQFQGNQLMISQDIDDIASLREQMKQAESYLLEQPEETPWDTIKASMNNMGFLAGWGRTAKRILESFEILTDILEAPDPKTLETFLGRIPMIFDLVIISPHGYFGQSGVLGLPDTGGQVVYILDQVRALEKEMRQQIYDQGLDIEPNILIITRQIPESKNTSCHQRMEHVEGTRNAKILRVPFRDKNGNIVPQWISRFNIYPYLERFAKEAENEILQELKKKPDLIIGNYTDGNLVATLLSQNLRVTQCNIAHALEKTKYLYSALYWKELEEMMHFSCQFTADLIAMNTADFIITSTYQEIAGKQDSIGQYESYSSFTMPGLYRVINGIDVFDPKFNIVSPGADSSVYFPYTDRKKRFWEFNEELDQLVFGAASDIARGSLISKEKPIIFSMARLDIVKNLTGLLEWYGQNPRLRKLANLLIVGGTIKAETSASQEEREQIEILHGLMTRFDLDGQVRWIGLQLKKKIAGELYRFIADRRGVFVQPALFEAFGLTIIEAMTSGLPTFATCYGGPLEIIEHSRSGFHIDPNWGEKAAESIADFLEEVSRNPDIWQTISRNSMERVKHRYNWNLYAKRMLTLSRIYGFWKYVTNLERQETRRYLEMFYGLMLRKLSDALPQ